jgi:hypothetical protein
MTAHTERNSFIGFWHITEMLGWDEADLDLLGEPAHVEFLSNRQGGFQVLAMFGNWDWKPDERNGKPSAEFSWIGFDDGSPVNGRGWAWIEDKMLHVKIFIQDGDDFELTAKRARGSGR